MVAKAWVETKSERHAPPGRPVRPGRVGQATRVADGQDVHSEAGQGASARGGWRFLEERFIQNDAVSLCLLLNHRTKTMRIIDFRAGPSDAKRVYVRSLAEREGIQKVFTVVERDEVDTWEALGFVREATLAGFYRRSDASVLGCNLSQPPPRRPTARPPAGCASLRFVDAADEPLSMAHERAEQTLSAAKKHVKELAAPSPVRSSMKMSPLHAADPALRSSVDRAIAEGRALTAFEAFGRDVERTFFRISGRGGFELIAAIEAQSCFGNAFLELLTGPACPAEVRATTTALGVVCDHLVSEGIASCFSLVPSDDPALAAAFLSHGFRHTGLLENHIIAGGARRDAIVFSRKLTVSEDD